MQRKSTLFIMACILISCPLLYSRNADFTWGVSMESVKKSLQADREAVTFYADDKPQYKNKILRHILNVDPTLSRECIILRINSRPVTDYLFVKGQLYSVLEDYENSNATEINTIGSNLKKLYGPPEIKEEGNEYTYSYNTSNTRVLFYFKKDLEGKIKSRVYYYPRKLFMMLISQ